MQVIGVMFSNLARLGDAIFLGDKLPMSRREKLPIFLLECRHPRKNIGIHDKPINKYIPPDWNLECQPRFPKFSGLNLECQPNGVS